MSFALYVPTLDGAADPTASGVGWGIAENGWKGFLELVEKTAFPTPETRRPDVVLVHAPGIMPVYDGQRRIVMQGWSLARTGTVQHGGQIEPRLKLRDTLDLWSPLLAKLGCDGWLYLGQVTHPTTDAMWRAERYEWRHMVEDAMRLARRAGFAGVFIDATGNPRHEGSGNEWGPKNQALVELREIVRQSGLGLGVEAYPHARMEAWNQGAPAWLTLDAYRTQHPKATSERWGQADPDKHACAVVVDHYSGQPYALDDWSLAEELTANDCIVGVAWNQWARLAERMGPRPLALRSGGAR
jgi:hypothetical protein